MSGQAQALRLTQGTTGQQRYDRRRLGRSSVVAARRRGEAGRRLIIVGVGRWYIEMGVVAVCSEQSQTDSQSGHGQRRDTTHTMHVRTSRQGKHSSTTRPASTAQHSNDSKARQGKAACLFLGEVERSRSVRHSNYHSSRR